MYVIHRINEKDFDSVLPPTREADIESLLPLAIDSRYPMSPCQSWGTGGTGQPTITRDLLWKIRKYKNAS